MDNDDFGPFEPREQTVSLLVLLLICFSAGAVTGYLFFFEGIRVLARGFHPIDPATLFSRILVALFYLIPLIICIFFTGLFFEVAWGLIQRLRDGDKKWRREDYDAEYILAQVVRRSQQRRSE